MAAGQVSAADRILNLKTGNGSSIWLEPMPASVGAVPGWHLTPIARLRASGHARNGKGMAATITPEQAREIADALVTWADLADRTAAGR